MKTKLLYFVLLLTGYAASAQDNPAMYEKFFPNPTYDIPFPIIEGSSSYYSGYNTTVEFINDLASKHPQLISISSIGASQRGFQIPLVTLAKKSSIPENQKIRVVFLASIHGNEPISTDGMLYLMNELSTNKKYSTLLDNIILKIVPIANVDGYKDDKRESNNETDLNRNLTVLDIVETVNLKNAINSFDPHLVVDFHEYNPSRKDYLELNDCYTSSYDAMFLYTGNLNVNSTIRKVIIDDFVTPTKKVLEQNNRKITDYVTTSWRDKEVILNIGGNSSRSSATNYALQNRISILMELRGVVEKGNAAKRRIETSFLTAISYLDLASKKADVIKNAIQKADQETFNKVDKIVLESKTKKIDFPFVFVNTCKNEYETVVFHANYNIEQEPIQTRERADGYVIVTKSKQVRKILDASGIFYQNLVKPTTLSVETFKQLDIQKFEMNKETKEIPEGAIVIDGSQKMGNLLIELLEPELANSLVANSLLKPFKGSNTLRIFRINKEQVLQLQNKK
jgi:Zinc carboxypeptidase